jgi:3-mercaptopyruvate sulfurtransferase SseA
MPDHRDREREDWAAWTEEAADAREKRELDLELEEQAYADGEDMRDLVESNESVTGGGDSRGPGEWSGYPPDDIENMA